MDAGTQQRMAKLDQILRSVPYQYTNKDRLRNDLQNLFRQVHTLQPQTGTFAGGGRSATLFYLYGVLPINYKGAAYNIPITMYFDPPYPKSAPRCFVTPTDNMAVSPNHPNVDTGGMFYCPMLSAWNERSSTLIELVSVMMSSFGANPPVYSTAGGARPPAQQPAAAAQPAGQPPGQDGGGLIGAVGGALVGLGGWMSGSGQQMPQQPGASATATAVQQQQPAAHVVAQPVARGGGKEALVQRTTAALKDRWPVVLGKIVAEINEQLDKRNELKGQADKLEHDLGDLKIRAEQQETQVKEMEATEAQLTAFIQANDGKDPDPDDLKNQLDPDSRQVLDMLAEELALDEFLTALDELLAARKCNIDDFLRETRDVARRKFMCSMQRKKCEAAVRAANGQMA